MANLYRVHYTRVWREPAKKFGADGLNNTVIVSATSEANAISAAKTADDKGYDSAYEFTFQVTQMLGTKTIIVGS